MANLKIAILIDQLVPGGVQKAAIAEAHELKKLGHIVSLLVLIRTKGSYQYEDLTKGLKIIFLSDYNPFLFKKALKIPYFYFLTHLHILSPLFVQRYRFFKDFDFIISHGTTTCITAAKISRKYQIPYLAFIWDPMAYILEHDYRKTPLRFFFFILKPIIRHQERSFLTRAAIITTPSRVHQKFLKELYFIDSKVIYPGCFPPQPTTQKTNKFFLGYTRWDLGKNPQLFIWLAKRFPKSKFLIAGAWTNSKEEAYFKNLVIEKKLNSRIQFVNEVKRSDMPKLASQSQAFVHPNFEAFGMAALEMASYGLPIIIPQKSGVSEIFQNGTHGFFPKSKKGLEKAVSFLIRNPGKAKIMGEKARIMSLNFTWEKHTKMLEGLIKNYLSKTKLLTIANAFVTQKSTGGGDIFAIELASRKPQNVETYIITPKVGFFHFNARNVTSQNTRFFTLGSTIFDDSDNRLFILAAYVTRALQTIFLLDKLPQFDVITTATDFFPDTLPAALYKIQRKSQTRWAARVFHIFESPLRRKGSFLINLTVHLLQKLTFAFLKRADLVMVDNPILARDLANLGFSKNKIEIHQGGVDIEKINSISNASNTSDAIFVGRLQQHKGIFDAIEVWEQVTKVLPNAKLNIMGYGPKSTVSELKNRINNKSLEKNIHFSGYFTSFEKIVKAYKSTKILLFLDHEAGFGLVVAEAMAAGTATVAYNLPIFGTTYKKGFLISDLHNIDKVAANVVKLLNDGSQWKKLSEEAKSESQKFDWEKISVKFYKSLKIQKKLKSFAIFNPVKS